MVDLSEFNGLAQAQDEGIDVPILHPKTGEELGITIKVAGPESQRQKRMRNALITDRMSRNRNRRVTAAEIEEDALKVSAAAIISLTGVMENGKAIEYSRDNAEDLLRRYSFIREQIDTAVSDRSVFIKS